VMTGIFVTAPFVIELLVGSDFANAYDRFPASERPLLFSLGLGVSPGVGVLAAFFLVLVLWPSVGWLNAQIMQPKSVRNAIGAGIRISILLCVLLSLLLGWVIIARTTTNTGSEAIQTLAEAVWHPDPDKAAEYREAADSMYKGLSEIPSHERAELVTERIRADKMSVAPLAILGFLLVSGFVSVPIVYGTVIGYALLGRGNSLFVSLIRHIIGWWATTFALVTAFGTVADGSLTNSSPIVIILKLVLVSFFVVVAWLVLRRWRRSEPVDVAERGTVLSGTS